MKSNWNTKYPMKILRWFGLHCILLGMLACSTSNNTVGLPKKIGKNIDAGHPNLYRAQNTSLAPGP